MKSQGVLPQAATALIPILISLVASAVLIAAAGVNPAAAASELLRGAFRDADAAANVVNFWIPLTFASIGLIITFRAGLWNIGVDGQLTMGAIFASAVALSWPLPGPLLIAAQLAAAMIGGGLWGALAGFLKSRLGVNEIFGGVALNQIANLATLYLITGPWQPAEGGSVRSSPPFPADALLPRFSDDFRVSPLMLIAVVATLVVVYAALRGTRWGLQLKATGRNARSALLLGVPTTRTVLSAFIVCGALAGLAGAFRALVVFQSLRPLVSGGIGFLAVLVALLAAGGVLLVPLITFAFSVLLGGSAQLKVALRLDVALVGVVQGILVLSALLFNGLSERWKKRRESLPQSVALPTPEPRREVAHE
ncbi:MAG: ABC transporter permease [Chloroflexota bacterium]|nr:ABC transporter permease [Chloroflexota bacterium]